MLFNDKQGDFMNIKKLLTMIVLAVALLIVVQGCNTMKGAGQDIENAGESVQDAAD